MSDFYSVWYQRQLPDGRYIEVVPQLCNTKLIVTRDFRCALDGW